MSKEELSPLEALLTKQQKTLELTRWILAGACAGVLFIARVEFHIADHEKRIGSTEVDTRILNTDVASLKGRLGIAKVDNKQEEENNP